MTDPRRKELKQLLDEERVDLERIEAENRDFDAPEAHRDEVRSARIAKLTADIHEADPRLHKDANSRYTYRYEIAAHVRCNYCKVAREPQPHCPGCGAGLIDGRTP